MGVTSTNDIVLSPDWNLVVGLLLGMLGLVLILLGFMYYFRAVPLRDSKQRETTQ
jgi:hypothetical protein